MLMNLYREPTNASNHEFLLTSSILDYELQRQANIAKNQALLKELQLNAASAGLGPSSKNRTSTGSTHSSAKPKKPTQRKPVKHEGVGPRRTSSRLQGIVADSEVAKRKAEEEHVAVREADRAKRMRRSDDLVLGDVVVVGKTENWNKSGNWLRDVRGAQPYERTFDEEDVKTTGDKDLRELREKMSGLTLWKDIEPARIKITPERIYSMSLHPTTDKAVVFAGDKMGNLGVFDGGQELGSQVKNEDDEEEDDDDPAPEITTFKLHTRTISTIHFTPSQPQSVYTASYDSSIRCLDLAKGLSTEVYGPADHDADDPISGLSIPITEPHMLYFTTLNGAFGMHDTRTATSTPSPQLLQLSDKKIGGFSVHPLHPHFLATASLDRTLKLWDLRHVIGGKSNRMPHLLTEHESRLSVSHAAFNAAGQIATSSYDDTIKIHTLPGLGVPSSMPAPGKSLPPPQDTDFSPTTIVPHNNQTGRWVTILRPHWQAMPSAVGGGQQRFCIGNMNRFVDVYAGTGEQLAQLGGEGITAVPAVASFHEREDWIAAGTASGKLALWM